MLSPSVYSPPRSLHLFIRIFHCWKQCCRPSSGRLFMNSVAFAFTASTHSNLVPFNADSIFGNKKKSHGARSGEYGGFSNTVILCFAKNLLTDRALSGVALFGEEPMSRSFTCQVFSSHPFTKVCKTILVVDLVNGLTFRHPIHVNNPSNVGGKPDNHCFKVGFALPCFLLP